MKKIYILLIAMLSCIACTQDALETATDTGHLSIGSIQLICDGEEAATADTRAIPTSLSIQILQGDVVIHALKAPVGEKPIALAVGTYQLRAYTDSPAEPADPTAPGEPIYEGYTPFEIKADELTLVAATATQTNLAVSVAVTDALITAHFPTYTTTITSETRTVAVKQGDKNLYYFALPTNKKLTYTMALTNSDNESFVTEPKTVDVAGKAHYTLTPTID